MNYQEPWIPGAILEALHQMRDLAVGTGAGGSLERARGSKPGAPEARAYEALKWRRHPGSFMKGISWVKGITAPNPASPNRDGLSGEMEPYRKGKGREHPI